MDRLLLDIKCSAGEEILSAAKRGDRKALAQIFFAHQGRIASQLRRLTGNPAASDDLLQEVFLAAFAALHHFRGDAKLSTWLHSIACNKVRNWWRAQNHHRHYEAEWNDHAQGSSFTTPEDICMLDEHRERFYEALAQLPEPFREAFTARLIEGMSLHEAAQALGIPTSTVSYRTRRAEKLLCQALDVPYAE